MKKEINSLSEEAVKLQSDIEAFQPERDRQDRAIKAASLDGAYATLIAIRIQQSDDQEALKVDEKVLLELESSAKEQAESLKSAEQQTIKAKEELKAAAPLIQKIISLDQKLAEQKEIISEVGEHCKKDAAKIDAEKQARLKEHQKRTDAERNLELADDYLKEHVRDEWLISGLAGVEEQLDSLLSRKQEIAQKEANCKKAEMTLEQAIKKLDECTKQCGTRNQELQDASKNLQQAKDALSELLGDRLLREYRTEKETLLREMAFLSKVAELEGHRAKLEDGKPCPLCGAKEHPFAEGNIPEPDETEKKVEALTKLISEAEEQEATIKKLEETEVAASKNLTDSEKEEATADNDKKTATTALTELKDSLGEIQTDFTELKEAVAGKLQPLGILEIPDDVSSLLESLKERLNAWQAKVKEKTDIEKQIADLDSEMKRLDAVIETQSNVLNENQERLETLKKEHTAGCDERKELYGSKKPDDEQLRLNKAIVDAEEIEKKAKTRHIELHQKLNTAKTHVESLNKRIDQRKPSLKKSEADFTTALAASGFSDEKQFLEARLTAEQVDILSAKAKELNDSQIDLKARQKDRETRLATEIAKKVTDKILEELEPQFKEYEESLKQLRDAIVGLKHKLSENTAAKKRMKEKQMAIEAQKNEYHRWEKLNVLIGSADGKKYRNFAQELTFELMVSHANRQLEKMTDRYLLIRDDEQPLELNVVDNYQAGEIRSTKNLSGGESFIVSLTLALGLSKMASRKVRVDSLFLDEGFGTLDEEALDTALETLSGLQQDGKLIGIISHVSALKERISTQITITPVSGGRSSLAGPGCNKVVNSE